MVKKKRVGFEGISGAGTRAQVMRRSLSHVVP